MSKCSKKCNEIKQKIDSISGLDDDYVYECLKEMENIVNAIVDILDNYDDSDKLNGTCFK